MNPARSIGPAIMALNFNSLYIFVIGPIIGAILSGVVYGVICPREGSTSTLLTRKIPFDNTLSFFRLSA
ncbi:hypothetical protein KP509_1Z264100 [Ceratopteris richardii]|nr:hypothetical protein KP509_1Z264100 [Ceratopteris richardii]